MTPTLVSDYDIMVLRIYGSNVARNMQPNRSTQNLYYVKFVKAHWKSILKEVISQDWLKGLSTAVFGIKLEYFMAVMQKIFQKYVSEHKTNTKRDKIPKKWKVLWDDGQNLQTASINIPKVEKSPPQSNTGEIEKKPQQWHGRKNRQRSVGFIKKLYVKPKSLFFFPLCQRNHLSTPQNKTDFPKEWSLQR